MDKQQLSDGGMAYFETNLAHYVAEPWNGITAALFVLLVSYWFFKIKGQFAHYPFISYILPILLVGGVGGTLYHAFRSYSIYLYMDWVPITILVLSASAYFFKVHFSSWLKSLGIMTGVFMLIFLIFRFTPDHLRFYAVNINYFIDAMLILVPTLLIIKRVDRQVAFNVYFAFGSFCLALLFRTVDHLGWLPMGTHFLWHVFGAWACHLMLRFIFRLEQELSLTNLKPFATDSLNGKGAVQ